MTQPTKLNMALTAYGMPHVMGYLATRDGQAHPHPLGLIGLMDAASELGLTAIEAPFTTQPVMSIDEIRHAIEARGLRFVPDFMVLLEAEVEATRDFLRAAASLGAPVVRATLSHVLCGDRRGLAGGWEAHLVETADRLNALLPYAEDLGICIAVENHQDASSDDLLRLADMTGNSPSYGITLDAGNPLAVGEGTVEFAARVAHLIRHIHVKDYTIHFAPEGFRLVRCAAGDGVVDFPAILEIVRGNGHDVLPGIEIAAQPTRTIPLLDPEWWACFPPSPATQLIPALRILWARCRPADEPYSSAWERGEDSATVAAEEWDVVRRSVEYFRGLEQSD